LTFDNVRENGKRSEVLIIQRQSQIGTKSKAVLFDNL